MSKVKIKVGPGGIMPTQTSRNVWALDLVAAEGPVLQLGITSKFFVQYKTGVSIRLPKNMAAIVTPRTMLNELDIANSSSQVRSGEPIIVQYVFEKGQSTLPVKGEKIATLLLITIPTPGEELEFEED